MVSHDLPLIEALEKALTKTASPEQRAAWQQVVGEAVHPLRSRGITIDPAAAEEIGRSFLGGAGGVFAAGSTAVLGPVRALQEARFHVSAAACLRVELWMPFARLSCGEWFIDGPGTTTLLMRETRRLSGVPPLDAADLGIVTVTGVHGTFPAWITFGP